LLDNGFFGIHSSEDKDNKKNISPFSSYSWSGQRKVPSYLHKIVFPQEFMSTLRTIAMQDHEQQVASLLGEVSAFSLCILSQELTLKTITLVFRFRLYS
jgi:hypothetical protein